MMQNHEEMILTAENVLVGVWSALGWLLRARELMDIQLQDTLTHAYVLV